MEYYTRIETAKVLNIKQQAVNGYVSAAYILEYRDDDNKARYNKEEIDNFDMDKAKANAQSRMNEKPYNYGINSLTGYKREKVVKEVKGHDYGYEFLKQ